MRPRLTIPLLIAAAALPVVAAAQPRTPGFQLQVDGNVYTPHGSVVAAGDAKLSSLLSSGPGLAVTASLGLSRHWVAAARVAYFGSEKDGTFRFVDDLNTTGLPFADGAGPYDLNRRLRATSVHGLLQYRSALGPRVEWALEAGGGLVSARERLLLTSLRAASESTIRGPLREEFERAIRLTSATGEKASAAGVQLDPSWVAGLGLACRAGWNSDVVAGARWTGSLSRDGALWTQGDSPSYLHWSLGVRYPHDTR